MQKTSIIIILLIVLFLGAAGYIVTDKYTQSLAVKEFNTFQEAAQVGYEQAVLQVIQQATNCQPVPLFANNQSVNLLNVDCLATGQ